jgi:enoyl-CoA hydratase/carnithine racemase
MDEVIVEKADGIGRIVFNRPEVKNALTPPMLERVMSAIAEFERDDEVRVLLFGGAGGSFTSGGDLKFLADLSGKKPFEIRNTVYSYFAGTAKAIKLCRKPTIAAVAGPAVGAGCEYAIACDFRIAAESAGFCETWINIGLIAPLGGMLLLPRMIGLGRATEMLMRGTTVRGEEAARIGLAHRCVPDDQLDAAALELARELAAGPPLAYATIKEGLRRGMESTLNAEWEFNLYAQAMLINSDDYAEAMQARSQKRKPRFQGKR